MPPAPASFQHYRYDFDLAQIIDNLHEALTPIIEDLIAIGRHQRVTSDEYLEVNKSTRQIELMAAQRAQRRERSGHISTLPSAGGNIGNGNSSNSSRLLDADEPCSFEKLVDIKACFDVLDVRSGLKGMREDTFLKVVAPVLCPNYPHRVREWFCTVDTSETGVVGWRSLSQHLASRGLHLGESLSREFKQLELATASSSQDADSDGAKPPLQFDEKPENHLASPTGFHVTRPFWLSAGRKKGYLGLCDDGCIRYFDNSASFHPEVLHFADNANHFRLVDMKVSRERPQAYVADTAGAVLVYDTDQVCCRTGTIVKGYRLQSANSVKPLYVPKTVKFDPLKMERPGMQMSSNRYPKYVKVDVDLLGLQSPVDITRAMVTSIEPRRQSNRDINFFVGFSEGTIASYSPELLNPTTTGPTQVFKGIHQGPVSCMQHHTANIELKGLISCSVDGSLVVTDLEKSTVKMRFANASASSDPVTTHNWVSNTVGLAADVSGINDSRSLTQFDVSPNLPIIAGAGTQRYVTLWSGQSRRHLITFADHRDDVVGLCFNNLYELVTLGSDRTIRVYDIRTYRPVQVIRDKERKYTGDPLTGVCIDGDDQAIVAWSGTPFAHRPIQGAVVLLAHGHPVTFADLVRDENGLSIALTTNDVFALHAADSGDIVFKYVCQRGPIKAIAHDDSWRRIFILTESAVEVAIVGERKPTRIFDAGGYRLSTIGFMQANPAQKTPSYIVGGNATSILFLSERNGSGVLQQEHNIPLLSLTKHKDSRKIEVVSVLSCHSDSGRVVVGTASGEVAVLMVSRNKVNVVFVFGADAITLTKTVAMMKREKTYTGVGKKLWERAVVASKKDDFLGGKVFTDFRHEKQGKLNTQCDSITLVGDRHCVIGFGSGDAAIAELSGDESRFIARFPAAFSTGIGCCYAYDDGVLVCGDDEGYLTRFDCDLNNKPLAVIEERSESVLHDLSGLPTLGRKKSTTLSGVGGGASNGSPTAGGMSKDAQMKALADLNIDLANTVTIGSELFAGESTTLSETTTAVAATTASPVVPKKAVLAPIATTATSVRTEKFFLDCYVAITNIMHVPFAVTALTMRRASMIVVGLECGKCVAVCPETLTFLWKGDVLINATPVEKHHQFIQYFGVAALAGGLYEAEERLAKEREEAARVANERAMEEARERDMARLSEGVDPNAAATQQRRRRSMSIGSVDSESNNSASNNVTVVDSTNSGGASSLPTRVMSRTFNTSKKVPPSTAITAAMIRSAALGQTETKRQMVIITEDSYHNGDSQFGGATNTTASGGGSETANNSRKSSIAPPGEGAALEQSVVISRANSATAGARNRESADEKTDVGSGQLLEPPIVSPEDIAKPSQPDNDDTKRSSHHDVSPLVGLNHTSTSLNGSMKDTTNPASSRAAPSSMHILSLGQDASGAFTLSRVDTKGTRDVGGQSPRRRKQENNDNLKGASKAASGGEGQDGNELGLQKEATASSNASQPLAKKKRLLYSASSGGLAALHTNATCQDGDRRNSNAKGHGIGSRPLSRSGFAPLPLSTSSSGGLGGGVLATVAMQKKHQQHHKDGEGKDAAIVNEDVVIELNQTDMSEQNTSLLEALPPPPANITASHAAHMAFDDLAIVPPLPNSNRVGTLHHGIGGEDDDRPSSRNVSPRRRQLLEAAAAATASEQEAGSISPRTFRSPRRKGDAASLIASITGSSPLGSTNRVPPDPSRQVIAKADENEAIVESGDAGIAGEQYYLSTVTTYARVMHFVDGKKIDRERRERDGEALSPSSADIAENSMRRSYTVFRNPSSAGIPTTALGSPTTQSPRPPTATDNAPPTASEPLAERSLTPNPNPNPPAPNTPLRLVAASQRVGSAATRTISSAAGGGLALVSGGANRTVIPSKGGDGGAVVVGREGSVVEAVDERGCPLASGAIIMRHQQGGIGGTHIVGQVAAQLSLDLQERLGLYTPPTVQSQIQQQRLIARSVLPPRPGTSQAFTNPSVNVGLLALKQNNKNGGGASGINTSSASGVASNNRAASAGNPSSSSVRVNGTGPLSNKNASRLNNTFSAEGGGSSSAANGPSPKQESQHNAASGGGAEPTVKQEASHVRAPLSRQQSRSHGEHGNSEVPLLSTAANAKGGIATPNDAIRFLANRCSYLTDLSPAMPLMTSPHHPLYRELTVANPADSQAPPPRGVGSFAHDGNGQCASETSAKKDEHTAVKDEPPSSLQHPARLSPLRAGSSNGRSSKPLYVRPVSRPRHIRRGSAIGNEAELFDDDEDTDRMPRGIGDDDNGGHNAKTQRLLQQKRHVLPAAAKVTIRNPSLCYQRLGLERVTDPKLPPSSGKFLSDITPPVPSTPTL